MCNRNSFKFLRLDGSTGNSQRQKYVDKFNEEDSDYCKKKRKSFLFQINLNLFLFKIVAFLLSTKAGGTGLNLIGANRLILFNSDWFFF